MPDINKISSIKRFKSRLVSELPYVPKNKAAKDYLLGLDVGDVIHIYDSWQQRLITSSRRDVIVSSKVRSSALYIKNRHKIKPLLELVRAGQNITKYLSKRAHDEAFDVVKFRKTNSFNSFRDQILVCEGFYHIHLEPFPKRTDEVLIVDVTPATFEVVMVAKHNLFENDSLAMEEYDKFICNFVKSKYPDGSVFIGGGIQNLAGSSIESSIRGTSAVRLIYNVEFNNKGIESYIKALYKFLENRDILYVKPEWKIINRELVIYDKKNKKYFKEENLNFNFNI